MDTLLMFIQTHVAYAPWVIFGALMLAGFNIPVSEDAMLFVSAVLARSYPSHLMPLFLAVYLGAYLSDLVCYGLGRVLGPKLFTIEFFASMAPPERIEKIRRFYARYGTATILLGRFIPFGVRNGLFLTAGLGKMRFLKFALADLTAATITTVTYFSLYYQYGEAVLAYVKEGNLIIFALAAASASVYFALKRKRRADQ